MNPGRHLQNHPLLFWGALLFLNVGLLVPGILLSSEPITWFPIPPLNQPRGWYDAMLFFLRRDDQDFFRLSVDVYAMLTLIFFLAKSRWASWGRRFCITVYFLLILYEIYETSSSRAFGVAPTIYNDAMLLIDLLYLIIDLWSFQRVVMLLGGLLAIFFFIKVVLFCFMALSDTMDSFQTSLRILLPGILLWGFIAWMGFWFGTLGDHPLTQWTFPKMINNLRASIQMHRLLKPANREAIDPLYTTYQDLHLVKKPNLYLLMIESYGNVLLDHPELRDPYTQLMRDLERDLRKEGWQTTTHSSKAPIQGGGSWLSIATVLSGIRIDNQLLYTRFISRNDPYPHFPHFLRQQGYHTITLQPPNRKRLGLPLDNYYGYDTTVFFNDLNYKGKYYGWGIIPDQYSLNYTHQQFLQSLCKPYFLFFETVTSHAPWEHLPPYPADWQELNQPWQNQTPGFEQFWLMIQEIYDQYQANPKNEQSLREIFKKAYTRHFRVRDADYPENPDTSKAKNYFDHIAYDWRVLRDFILEKTPANSILIVTGDHQPSVVSRKTDGFEIPIHLISKDKAYLESFRSYGFVPGMLKPSDAKETMNHEGIFSLIVRSLAHHYGEPGTVPPPHRPNGIPYSILLQ